jgi:hypothetical protein
VACLGEQAVECSAIQHLGFQDLPCLQAASLLGSKEVRLWATHTVDLVPASGVRVHLLSRQCYTNLTRMWPICVSDEHWLPSLLASYGLDGQSDCEVRAWDTAMNRDPIKLRG